MKTKTINTEWWNELWSCRVKKTELDRHIYKSTYIYVYESPRDKGLGKLHKSWEVLKAGKVFSSTKTFSEQWRWRWRVVSRSSVVQGFSVSLMDAFAGGTKNMDNWRTGRQTDSGKRTPDGSKPRNFDGRRLGGIGKQQQSKYQVNTPAALHLANWWKLKAETEVCHRTANFVRALRISNTNINSNVNSHSYLFFAAHWLPFPWLCLGPKQIMVEIPFRLQDSIYQSARRLIFAGSPWGQLGLCFWLSVISMSFAALMSHCTCTYVHVYLNMCAWLCRRTADLHSVYVQTKLFSGLSLQIFVTIHSSYKVDYFVCIILNYFPYGVYIYIY